MVACYHIIAAVAGRFGRRVIGASMNEYVALLLGIAGAGVGGELFVRGTVGLATVRLRFPLA